MFFAEVGKPRGSRREKTGKRQTALSRYQDDGGRLPESEASPRHFLHRAGENSHDVKLQHRTAQKMCAAAREEPLHDAKTPSASGHTLPEEAPAALSRVPLRVTARRLKHFPLQLVEDDQLSLIGNFQLQIKVCGERGGLGLSIAGGKGSLPYKNRHEVSRRQENKPAGKPSLEENPQFSKVFVSA